MRVSDLTKTFGGSIGGFAAAWVETLSELSAEDIRKVRHFVTELQSEKQVTQSRKG